MKKNADVVIIGGGINRLFSGLLFSTKREEGHRPGEGKGARIWRIRPQWWRGTPVRERQKRTALGNVWCTITIWPQLSEELGMDVEYYQQGNLRLGKTDEHLETSCKD